MCNLKGCLIPGILSSLTAKNKLYAAYVNSKIIAKQYASIIGVDSEDFFNHQRALKLYEDKLINAASHSEDILTDVFLNSTFDMSSRLIDSHVDFDLYSMLIGCFLGIQVYVVRGLYHFLHFFFKVCFLYFVSRFFC